MGMTIDEAIEVLEYLKTQNSQLKSINFAISILRKYQKIEEIITDWESDGGAFEMSESYWLRLVSGVIADGNDD